MVKLKNLIRKLPDGTYVKRIDDKHYKLFDMKLFPYSYRIVNKTLGQLIEEHQHDEITQVLHKF